MLSVWSKGTHEDTVFPIYTSAKRNKENTLENKEIECCREVEETEMKRVGEE